jgi:glutamine phosphoribosylpyrophosphate amidotransferase
MCGVVGVTLTNPTADDLQLIRNVFMETQIRGKHASGIAWYNGVSLEMIKDGVPISVLLKSIDFGNMMYVSQDGTLKISCIGHIRYSTSDIHYHQPLGHSDFGYIVHNGVITQEDPSSWNETYGYECETKNDSELIYHTIKSGKHPLEEFPTASISALSIDTYGNIVSYRNSLRPQWKYEKENGIIYASTKNILLRAGAELAKISMVQSPFEEKQIRHMELDYAETH